MNAPPLVTSGMQDAVSLVYYIGAGASAKSLPLVSNTPSRMRDLANELSNGDYELDSQHSDVLKGLCSEMKGLADRSASCPSIDVLAQHLHLQGNAVELRMLKATLSAYYVLEQSCNPSDPRYGDFFAYMADKDASGTLAMPTDVRVVSWNYDMQFEKSFAELIHDPRYEKRRGSGKMLQVVPTGIESPEHYDDIFSIYKLNGTAGTRDNREILVKSYDPVVYGQAGRLDSGDLRLTLHFYEKVTSGNDRPYLQFAWEDDDRRDSVLRLIRRFAPVEILVVIGYSFPLLNRDLDRSVLEVLSPNEVFLQVAGDEAVMDRLAGLGVESQSIKVVRDQDQFHIPHSYSPSARLSRSSRDEQDRDARQHSRDVFSGPARK